MYDLILGWVISRVGAKVVEKVWGWEYWIVNLQHYCFKVLVIRSGYRCSMHYHPIKDETFIVVTGKVKLEQIGVRGVVSEEILDPGQIRHIEPKTGHRFSSEHGALIFEISTHHDDADVVRLADSGKI